MSNVYESLSLLLDDDLDDTEREELLALLDADPRLQRVHHALQHLPLELAGLDDIVPPPALNEAVLARVTKTRPATASTRSWIPWAAAAAIALTAAMLPSAPTKLTLEQGSQLVDGRAVIRAADAVVEVDGRAQVTVRSAGEPRAEDAVMNASHLVAAGAGSIITIAVYQGTATLRASDGTVVELGEGQTRTIDIGAPGGVTSQGKASRGLHRRVVAPLAAGGSDDAEARIALLQAEIDALRLRQAFDKGRIESLEGAASAWPQDVPDAMEPEQWETDLRALLSEQGAGEVVALDCDEYPCIAVVDPAVKGPGWNESMEALGDAYKARHGLTEGGVGLWLSQSNENGVDRYLAGVSLAVPDGLDAETQQALHRRTNYRMDGLMQDALEEMRIAQ